MVIFFSTFTWGNFNFSECSGSNTFEQKIAAYNGDYEKTVNVGEIPAGIEGLYVELVSEEDIDIRLYAKNGDKIVHWPLGLLHNPAEGTKEYKGIPITYSGYNGKEGKRGHEFIRVSGSTPSILTMKAFGYKAGSAIVNYSWTGKEGCEVNPKGTGEFKQAIPNKDVAVVGMIPANIDMLEINLDSDKDIDIQLFGADGTAIVSWNPKGLLSGKAKQTIEYHGMHIEWSGYNGINGQKGHEYIKVLNATTEQLTMKVYGYESGLAEVQYQWGMEELAQRYGVASQGNKSRTYKYYSPAGNVLDHNASTHNHTENNSGTNWVQVSLAGMGHLSTIKVQIGLRAFAYRLNNAKVYLLKNKYRSGDSVDQKYLIGTLTGTKNVQVFTFDSIKDGQYIVVKGAGGDYLHISQIEAYGTIDDAAKEEIAKDRAHPHGYATQGTPRNTNYRYFEKPSHIIDNDDVSYQHTRENNENWAQIEFPNFINISKLMIKGRSGATEWRLAGAKVYIRDYPYHTGDVLDEKDAVATLEGSGSEQLIDLPISKQGLYVLIKAQEGSHLHVATVKVYGAQQEIENCISNNDCDGICNTATSQCMFHNICGNSVKETAESCDDGNTVDGDGCSSTCKLEAGVSGCTSANDCFKSTCDSNVCVAIEDGIRRYTAAGIAAIIDAKKKVLPVANAFKSTTDGGLFNETTGQWSDITYIAGRASEFRALDHILRSMKMARCYVDKTCGDVTDARVIEVLNKAFRHFGNSNYKSRNWWWGVIGLPLFTGRLLTYVYHHNIPVAASDYAVLANSQYITSRTSGAGYGWGANSLDINMAGLMAGIIRNNLVQIDKSLTEAMTIMDYHNVGVNADHTLFAHGAMLNTLSYGTVFTLRMTQFYNISHPFYDFTESTKHQLSELMVKGMRRPFRGKYSDYFSIGRGLSRYTSIPAGFDFSLIGTLFPERESEIWKMNRLASGKIPVTESTLNETKGSWVADYLTVNRPKYHFSTLGHSSRTYAIEQINQENRRGVMISEGAYSIRVVGDEYAGILPLWYWSRVPGVTGRWGQKKYIAYYNYGAPFSGVMSANNKGIAVHSQNQFGIAVEKSTFTFDDMIVVMGDGITSSSSGLITTSVDQSIFRGDVIAKSKNAQDSYNLGTNETFLGDDMKYFYHRNIAYYPLDNKKYHLEIAHRKGNWSRINSTEVTPAEDDVFMLYIDYGENITNEHYAYAIKAGVTHDEAKAESARNRFLIDHNKTMHSIYDKNTDTLMMVLRQPGTGTVGNFSIKTSVAGMFMIESATKKNPIIHFADPTQKFKSVDIEYHHRAMSAKVSFISPDYKVKNVSSKTVNMQNHTLLEDTYLRYGQFASNTYGTEDELISKWDNEDNRYIVLVKLKISEWMRNAPYVNLVLDVKESNNKTTLSMIQVDNDWSESTVTGETGPESIGSQFPRINKNKHNQYNWGVTSQVKTALEKGETTISFYIYGISKGANHLVKFYSKESQQPHLAPHFE